MNNRILVLSDYYLPGFKAGGPIRSISNMVDSLSTRLDFSILTRNHDLNTYNSYDGIKSGEWIVMKNYRVLYLDSNFFRFVKLFVVLLKGDYDIIYINSFFSFQFSILPLSFWLIFLRKKHIVLAPRGEFSTSALEIGKWKKNLYLKVFNFFKIYNKIHWQASSKFEADHIKNCFPNLFIKNISVASDLLIYPQFNSKTNAVPETINDNNKILKLVFISRIAEIKNLDFVLKLLRNTKRDISMSIYGPIEDESYWNYCLKIMEDIGTNIVIEYCGDVNHDSIYEVFGKYDLFVFPTKGENFGHVVFESLVAGTSVLLSNQTPWQSDENFAIDIIPLERPEIWLKKIEEWATFDNQSKLRKRENAKKYTSVVYDDDENVNANLKLFKQFL